MMDKKEKIIYRIDHESDPKKVLKKLDIGLPKWSALVIVGDKVTEDQATEIIIRTDSLYFSSNDSEFEKQLYEAMGVTLDDKDDWVHPIFNELQEVKKSVKGISGSLEYMGNHRIVSSWICGPHGWCNWDGTIFCNNYNIGKYPTTNRVHDELCELAKEFQFLNMSCQLFSGEGCEEESKPVIQFDIEDGFVYVREPTRLAPPTFDMNSVADIMVPGRERGCTIEKFKEAFEFVKEKFKDDKKENGS